MAKQDHEKKDGLSVQEIENFGKHYRLELFFSGLFFVASICSFLIFSPAWSIYALGLGGILGAVLGKHVSKLVLSVFNFAYSQQKPTKIAIAVVAFIIAILIPPVCFLGFGLLAGKNCIRYSRDCCKIHISSREHHDH